MLTATQGVFLEIQEANNRYADFLKDLKLVQDEDSDASCEVPEDVDLECKEIRP